MKTGATLKMDDRFVYSASGKPYRRRVCKHPGEVTDRRLPYIHSFVVKGYRYYYFAPAGRGARTRLPDPSDVGFDHAYLCELAKMEGAEPPKWEGHRGSSIYFVQAATGQIKIGTALNVETRLAALRSHSPVALDLLFTMPGGYREERAYHTRFSAHRLHGEWFDPHPDILAEIERLQTAVAP